MKNHAKGLSPLVSIIICVYDGDAQFLKRAIDSLVRQTLPKEEMELLITYDGEPSQTGNNYLEDACKGVPFPVRAIYSRDKIGYYTIPRNRALPLARGLYIYNMDADNEAAPEHLELLLDAIRTPHEAEGWPHFVYSRRFYIKDEGVRTALPEGPSPLVEWEEKNINALVQGPRFNFVDTGDMLIPRSVLYELAERTGFVWNPEVRRFADWELVKRMAQCGFRGLAVDSLTNRYHWTGTNVSTSRAGEDFFAIPAELYERLKAEGKVKA
jgi:glycosyltransferase involved in cell wall biosynthesis